MGWGEGDESISVGVSGPWSSSCSTVSPRLTRIGTSEDWLPEERKTDLDSCPHSGAAKPLCRLGPATVSRSVPPGGIRKPAQRMRNARSCMGGATHLEKICVTSMAGIRCRSLIYSTFSLKTNNKNFAISRSDS